MTLARSLLALLLTCMITAPCRGQAATQPAGLDKLTAALASEDFKTREAAQKQIIELGEDAVPAMKKLAETASDPELQGRAAEILRRIEAESLVKPTRVTLKFNNAPAGE